MPAGSACPAKVELADRLVGSGCVGAAGRRASYGAASELLKGDAQRNCSEELLGAAPTQARLNSRTHEIAQNIKAPDKRTLDHRQTECPRPLHKPKD